MPAPESRAEYDRRMHRVLAHIDVHLDQPLELATLAEIAHFSPFHFHRLFVALMGETLADYVRRRRVEVAAMRMVAQPRLSVLRAALDVGFGSGEAFSRAFRAHFDCSPSAWRTQRATLRDGAGASRNPGQLKRNPDQDFSTATLKHDDSIHKSLEFLMNVKLVDRKPVHVAYFRYTGPYGDGVSAFWQSAVYPWLFSNNLLNAPRYGISHDDPGITAPEQCRYDACVEVAPSMVLAGKAFPATIPGGRYAVLPFKGTVGEIGDAWSALLRDWLPDSGLQIGNGVGVEHYPEGASFDPATGIFDCEICIPVKAL